MITEALLSLVPGAQWSMIDEDYDTLDWSENNTQQKPTKEEVDVEVARLQAIKESLKYKEQRVGEYPSIQDQLDSLYHDIKNGTLDSGEWINSIEFVKNKYPKT
jgi:hypothetical protein